MKKDIDIPKNDGVSLAFIKKNNFYEAHLLNKKNVAITDIFLHISASKGDKKTSTFRRKIERLPAVCTVKIENILPEVLEFTSTYLVSYFADNTLYDFKVKLQTPDFSKSKTIDLLNTKGIELC